MRFVIVVSAVVLALVLVVHGASALAAQERGGEHGGASEHGGAGEGGGGDGEESGTLYGLGEAARQRRAGVDLVIRYDAPARAFVGRVRNTTTAPIEDIRVEVHLSNGVELGPTPRRDLAPGAVADVRLDARGQSFQRWSVHAEIGQSEPEPAQALRAAGVGASALLLLAGGRRLTRFLPILVLAAALVGCGDSPTGPSEVHGREGGNGGEAGESGMQYGIDETARESRAGVDLVMAFDRGQAAFTGTVTNTTAAAVDQVRVEIHLSNGVELGPTPRVTLAAGEVRDVRLDGAGQTFTTWSVHVEIGPGT